MEIVDYSTPRRGEDLSSPNVTRSTAIVADTPRSQVIEERIFITERRGPVTIGSDEQIEVLNLIEAGEIVSIEVVSDNPYLGLYLELDDYKNKEPNGITAAELLMRGRNEYSEREFYAEDRRNDGTYVVKYHPRKSDKYTDKIRLIVRNDIRKNNELYGYQSGYTSRGNIPSPSKLGYLGGGSFTDPAISALGVSGSTDNPLIMNALTRPLGVQPYNVNIVNENVRNNPLLPVGESHPYVGGMGKVLLTIDDYDVDNPRVKFFPIGTAASGTTGAPSAVATPWPGNSINGSSRQQIAIYAGSAESETATFTNPYVSRFEIGSRVWFKDGDTIHFPGKLTAVHKYDQATSQFVAYDGSATPLDGGYILTVEPGLKLTPTSFDVGDYNDYGYLRDGSPKATVHEIVVRRVRTKYLNG